MQGRTATHDEVVICMSARLNKGTSSNDEQDEQVSDEEMCVNKS